MPYLGYDIKLATTDPVTPYSQYFRVFGNPRQSDITPSSARRTDGDARYQLIPSESFWSQSDWSGGFGRRRPADPAAYFQGTIDSSRGTRLTQALEAQNNWATPAAAAVPLAMIRHRGLLYIAVNDAGTGKLYSFDASTATWALITALASASVTSMASFRGEIWIAYGTASDVQKWNGAALSAPAPVFRAQVLAPYTSMMFYVFYDSTATKTCWRVNRYDPENTGAVPDLAILPRGNETTDYVRSLVSVGGSLYLVCQDSLWSFTSPNGNSGTLVGPLDEWIPYGGAAGSSLVAGYGACTYQGQILYSTGTAIRRYFPNGQAQMVWPVLPMEAPFSELACDMVQAHDRVYIVTKQSVGLSSTTFNISLWVWSGVGMHQIATKSATKGAGATELRPRIAADNNGYIGLLETSAGSLTTGSQLAYVPIPGVVASGSVRYVASSAYLTSYLDFGLADLEKVIPYVAVTASVPNTSTYTISVVLTDLVTNTNYTLTQYGTFSTTANTPSTCYYKHPSLQSMVSKQWLIQVTITGPASATATAIISSVSAIPNPVYPVRYGFRCDLDISVGVKARDNSSSIANQAAVLSSLAFLRIMRASKWPYVLSWVDGLDYTVRTNTITFTKNMMIDPAGDEESWTVTLDLQQVSN